jgi:hypothetical protein
MFISPELNIGTEKIDYTNDLCQINGKNMHSVLGVILCSINIDFAFF